MAKEIEKKFLLWENDVDYSTILFHEVFGTLEDLRLLISLKGVDIMQGYIPIEDSKEILTILESEGFLKEEVDFTPDILRLRNYGGKYLFTIKSKGKMERDEIEFPISKVLFDELWPRTACKQVKKRRYVHDYDGLKLEIDLYEGRKLITLEIECASKKQAQVLPVFGKEVTLESRYANSKLAAKVTNSTSS